MSTDYDTSTEIGTNPQDFVINNNEWWYIPPVPDAKAEYVSRFFKVMARVHDLKNGGWGRIIEFNTDIGKPTSQFIADGLLHDTPRKLAMALADSGLALRPTTKAHWALQLLLTRLPGRHHVYVGQSGWTKNDNDEVAFVMPSGEVVGAGGIIMRPERSITGCEPRGELAEWKREVAANAVGNSRLAFAMSITFAAPLLKDTGRPNGGIHFNGESQIGKTTITQCAASVMGNPAEPPEGILSSWHATANAVEAIFARSNDCLLAMDEMGQAPPNDVAQIIYKMGNGSGKGRMRADSSFRDNYQWRTLAISTGEEKAENKIRQAKGRMTAGVDARLANVPADPGKDLGVFEQLHGFKAPKALADHLRAASKRYYGTAFPVFIKRLMEERKNPEFIEGIQNDCQRFIHEYVPEDASSQVKSVAHRFALASVAGELAAKWEILPWKPGIAEEAAVACMRDWIEDRGSVGQGEQADVIERLREYIGANLLSRFPEHIIDNEGRELNRSDFTGVRREEGFCILKDQWKKIMPDVPAARAMRILHAAGFIDKQYEGFLTRINLHSKGSIGLVMKCYVIKHAIFE